MAKKIEQERNPPLHFFGERQRPDRPEMVLDRRFVLGDRKITAEFWFDCHRNHWLSDIVDCLKR